MDSWIYSILLKCSHDLGLAQLSWILSFSSPWIRPFRNVKILKMKFLDQIFSHLNSLLPAAVSVLHLNKQTNKNPKQKTPNILKKGNVDAASVPCPCVIKPLSFYPHLEAAFLESKDTKTRKK